MACLNLFLISLGRDGRQQSHSQSLVKYIERKHIDRQLFLMVVFLAIIVRVLVFVTNRSFIMDEANLALNVIEKNYLQLFGQLSYEQFAPPLYLTLAKFSASIFGSVDWAYRLPSLLAGILSIILLYNLASKMILSKISIFFTLFMFGFSPLAIRYTTEFKQYGIDSALAILFIYLGLQIAQRNLTQKGLLGIGILGFICIWMSMPLIFTLAGVGIMFLYESIKKDYSKIIYTICIGIAWLASFYIYYTLILSRSIDNQNLQIFHNDFFINLLPFSFSELSHSTIIVSKIFKSVSDKTFLSIAFSALTFMTGCGYLLCRNSRHAILLICPILFCLIASHLQLYSLIPRLIVFFIPIILLIMGIGLSYILEKSNVIIRAIIVIIMVIVMLNIDGYKYLWTKMEYEEIKDIAHILLLEKEEDDFIYVHHDGVPAFRFYNIYQSEPWSLGNYYLAKWNETPGDLIKENTDIDRFWILFSHTFPSSVIEENLNKAESFASRIYSYESVEASIHLFIKDPPHEN